MGLGCSYIKQEVTRWTFVIELDLWVVPVVTTSVSLSLRNSLSSAWVLPGCWRMVSVYLSETVDSDSLSVKGNLDSWSELAKKIILTKRSLWAGW